MGRGSEVYVDQVEGKGRILRAARSFSTGEVLFREKALVYASWELDLCVSCDVSHPELDEMECPMVVSLFGESITSQLSEIVDFLVELDAVGEVDRARMLLKCIALVHSNPTALDELLSFCFVNLDKCTQAAQLLQCNFPDLFTKTLTVSKIATLLAILNTNSHELEHLQGSGLFPTACMMEHACLPSCNFTTYGDELWITAIQPIEPNEALSIDYGNFFYRPTSQRQEMLKQSYGFDCICHGCTQAPDRTRAFVCRACPEGVMCYFPTLKALKCLTCATVETDTAIYFKIEQQLSTREFGSLSDIDNVLALRLVHSTHHIIFWALDRLGSIAAQQFQVSPMELKTVWERIINAAITVVPTPHSEKVMYFDKLGQIRACLGDVQGVKEAFGLAYEESCRVSGSEEISETTNELLQLFQNPPTSRAETLKRYNISA